MKKISIFLMLMALVASPLRVNAIMEGREENKREEGTGGVDRTQTNSREAAKEAAKKQAVAPSEEKSSFRISGDDGGSRNALEAVELDPARLAEKTEAARDSARGSRYQLENLQAQLDGGTRIENLPQKEKI